MLSCLKRLPADTRKINQPVARDITSDVDDDSIVTAIITMEESLGLKVTAEGVELPGQLAFWRGRGSNGRPSYLFSRPPPAAEIRRLRSGKKR